MEALVTTSLGKVRGITKANHRQFLGIRYAEPPIGNLRFAEPQPVEAWDGIYDATKYASIAPQVWEDDPPIELEENEDCLFLNVCTPETDDKQRPVMFFIHGGAYGIGSGSRPRLFGGHLAERGDVVVVTIQYRLGPLGWLYMDGIPPNLGLKDQICALRWVKDNIAAFGGDPGNITIFGQSAGSLSVSYLLIMPEAEGLFQKAIAQSATYQLEPWTPDKATKLTQMLFSKLQLDYGDIESLRQLHWKELIQAQRKIGKDVLSENHHSPVLDGASIPEDPLLALRSGFARNIPLMIGHISDELPIFEGFMKDSNFIVQYLTKRVISKRIVSFGLHRNLLKKVLSFYKKELSKSDIPNKEYDLLVTDMGFRLPAILVADTHSESKTGTFMYEFAYKAPKLGTSVHALDLFFVFGTLNTTDISDAMKLTLSTEERRLSNIMMDAWTSFARTGNPNNDNLPNWKQYNSDSRSTMIFDVPPELSTNHHADRIRFWKSIELLT